jgi:DNA-binding CsgD family transcriptional regulator
LDFCAVMIDLIESIYEAAFVPELWSAVLQEACDLSASASAQIFVFSENASPRGITLQNLRPLFDWFIEGETWKFCDSVQKMCAVQPASFVQVDDFMTQEEIARDPARVMLREFGIGAHLCTAVAMPTGELATFVFQKWMHDGKHGQAEFDRRDALRPHFARAGLVAARLGFKRAEATASTLEIMGLPAAVLSSGRVMAANARFQEKDAAFLPVAHGGLALANGEANRLFQKAVIGINQTTTEVCSIPVPATGSDASLVVHLLPLRRAAHEVFAGGDTLVLATAIAPTKLVPSASLLNALFDLTPAEARLATDLADDLTLAESAVRHAVTVKTARTYLERIFRKTGTRRQSQLVNMLKAVQPPLVSPPLS